MSPDETPSPPPRLSVALRELRKGFGNGAGRPRATRELRRFVPCPLADRIERGERIDLGELEVAVLVADLRGYTAFTVSHRPREVFELVGCYAQRLARAVEAHGGAICEVAGDAAVAVFGAPDPIPDRARAALQAARRICAGMEDVPGLRVGVGVASGSAYVGGIRAGDRVFWSAFGATAKRAAWLQHLTRRLAVAAAVDAETFREARPDVADLVPFAVPDEGRGEPDEIWALPRERTGRGLTSRRGRAAG